MPPKRKRQAKRKGAAKANRGATLPPLIAGVPIGDLAQAVANMLRTYGGNPASLPSELGQSVARRVWMQSRQPRPLARVLWGDDPATMETVQPPRVPPWLLDLALAIVEQVSKCSPQPPRRRRRGKPRDPDTEELELWLQGGGTIAENARFVAQLRASREGRKDADIESDTQRLARRKYRRKSRNDVP